MTFKNDKELQKYLLKNYDSLDFKFIEYVLLKVYNVYTIEKPSKETLLKYFEFINQLPQGYEKPIFINNEI